jgi:DUF2946 family protein
MDGLRRHRRLIAWIAVVALLGNVAASLFSPAFAQRSASDYPVDLLGPLVICSEHGTQTLASDDGKAPPAPATHCPMCLAPAVFAFILALAAALLLAPPATRERFALAFRDTLEHRLRRAGLGSRAPPFPA